MCEDDPGVIDLAAYRSEVVSGSGETFPDDEPEPDRPEGYTTGTLVGDSLVVGSRALRVVASDEEALTSANLAPPEPDGLIEPHRTLVPTSSSSPEEEALDKACVANMLQELDPDERKAVFCFYLANMTLEEIALTMGLSKRRTSTLIGRGLLNMRNSSHRSGLDNPAS